MKNETDRELAHTCEMRGAYTSLVGRREGKRPFGRPRSSREGNRSVQTHEENRVEGCSIECGEFN
jgi:hypothetical protein